MLSIRQRKAIFMAPKHMKYIVRARFSRCGHYFATAAYDNECRIFKENPVANDNGGDMYRRIKVLNCSGHVECLAFSPDVDDSTSEMVQCSCGGWTFCYRGHCYAIKIKCKIFLVAKPVTHVVIIAFDRRLGDMNALTSDADTWVKDFT